MQNPGFFHEFIERQRAAGALVLQPRMGFSDHASMRSGLAAVARVEAPTLGTITVDSKTRTGDLAGARRAIDQGVGLNGYPIASYGEAANRRLIGGLHSADFPIQVRHGSARPEAIFEATMACGLDATEGGPISYCLPYSRTPLADSIRAWDQSCRRLAGLEERGTIPHLESFGGCMMGQLCPPSLLVALSVLEGIFFARKGLRSLSLSYAQGTHSAQDVGALLALRRLAGEHLGEVTWHVVLYTFMGLFPATRLGALRLIEESVRVARQACCERLIVKTVAEAHQIPEIDSNIEALETAARVAAESSVEAPSRETSSSETLLSETLSREVAGHHDMVLEQARHIVEAVLDLHPSLDRALALAFERGHLDVPYCLHPDNRNEARAWIDGSGAVHWMNIGRIPLPPQARTLRFARGEVLRSSALLEALAFNRDKYDALAAP